MLADQPLSALAERVNLGERQLRRLFVERIGAAPIGVHGTRRLLFAKQLLTETAMPITEVALAAGFGSLRRFNAVFLEAYRMAPRDLRKRPATQVQRAAGRHVGVAARVSAAVRLRLDARVPAWTCVAGRRGRRRDELLAGDRAAEARKPQAYEAPGWLRVSAWPDGEHALKLELHGVPPARLIGIVNRLRRMFDLDADPQAIADALSQSPRLRPLLRRNPGLRLPSGWDGFEIAVRAVIGQQVSVAAARTVAARLSQRFGQALPVAFAPGLEHVFPTPEALADADLASIGMTRARAETVRTVAQALLDGRVDFRPERTLDDFTARWVALPGIGPWTANYIALRAMGHPDAFPAEDLVLQRAAPNDGSRLSAKALTAQAEAWRPWRGYAVIHLWRDSMNAPKPEKTKQAK